MDILRQCQKWHEENKFRKIVDAIEALDDDHRSGELDMELARALNNLASFEDEPELYRKAVEALERCQDELENTHLWQYRMGYARYYMDQDGWALDHFRKALELLGPDDPEQWAEDNRYFITQCEHRTALPAFNQCFAERVRLAWDEFVQVEERIRKHIDGRNDDTQEANMEVLRLCSGALNRAFTSISYELRKSGELYELIVTPEGYRVRLFEIEYFIRHAPEQLREHWKLTIGRQAAANICIISEGCRISAEDVTVWVAAAESGSFALKCCCEKLEPAFEQQSESFVWWLLTNLTDQTLGELVHMRYIESFDLLRSPADAGEDAGEKLTLDRLPQWLADHDCKLDLSARECLDLYTGYSMKPNEDPNADWRLDIIAGSTCCVPLVQEYLSADNDVVNALHSDGVAAGFFIWPLDKLKDGGSEKIFAFRDELEAALSTYEGREAVTVTGGGTGCFCGYLDFIAWDPGKTLQLAGEFFDSSSVDWAYFHSFRRDAATVPLKHGNDNGRLTSSVINPQIEDGLEYIAWSEEQADAFYEQLEQWNKDDKFSRCIAVLNTVPESHHDLRFAIAMARALENYAIIGDDNDGTARHKGDIALNRAIVVLKAVQEDGKDDVKWNMRMAYGYQYLYGNEEQAIAYARRWAELDPDDEQAPDVIEECLEEIEKRMRIEAGIDSNPGSILD